MSILAYVTGDAPHLLKLRRAKQKNTRRGASSRIQVFFLPVYGNALESAKIPEVSAHDDAS